MDARKTQSTLLKALAHPARLRILEVLAREEACVCHLTTALKQRQPYISQHLMQLREAGLVSDRRDGLMIYYSLAQSDLAQLIALSREMAQRLHPELAFAALPVGPIAGCPCPRCQAALAAIDPDQGG